MVYAAAAAADQTLMQRTVTCCVCTSPVIWLFYRQKTQPICINRLNEMLQQQTNNDKKKHDCIHRHTTKEFIRHSHFTQQVNKSSDSNVIVIWLYFSE